MSKTKKNFSRIIAFALAMILSIAMFSATAETANAASNGSTMVEGEELYSWNFELLDHINADRAKNGRSKVVMDGKLMEYATMRAYELYFEYDHTRPNGKPSFSIAPELDAANEWKGENIYMRAIEDANPEVINKAFYNSTGHRDIMLNTHHTCVGVACVRIGEWIYIVEIFAGPSLNKQTVTANQYKDTYRIRTVDTVVCKSMFADVPLNTWYTEPVEWAANSNITKGTSANTFSPDATCTRAQVVTFLWRSQGSPEPVSKRCPFTDIKSGDYFYKAVLWANEQGITKGTSGTHFSPSLPCTRAQVVTFLWRTEKMPSWNGPYMFFDVPVDAYYYNAVQWAALNGITTGIGGGFQPDGDCTRAQIVTFLWRDMGVC